MVTQHPGEPVLASATAVPELATFFDAVRQLPEQIRLALSLRATEEEQRILAALLPVMTLQLTSLGNLLIQRSDAVSPQTASDVRTLLNVTAAVPLAGSALSVAGELEQPVTRLVLSDIFHLIKKIINRLAGLLHISIPGIVLDLIGILDELVNGALGVGAPGVAVALMERQRLQVAELVEEERLQEAADWRRRAQQEGNTSVSAT